MSLVVGGMLVSSVLIVGVVGWHELICGAVRRWRMYCMMLVVGSSDVAVGAAGPWCGEVRGPSLVVAVGRW